LVSQIPNKQPLSYSALQDKKGRKRAKGEEKGVKRGRKEGLWGRGVASSGLDILFRLELLDQVVFMLYLLHYLR